MFRAEPIGRIRIRIGEMRIDWTAEVKSGDGYDKSLTQID